MATYASLKYDWGAQLTGALPTAAIADDAITLAKMASGTDGNIITYDASGNPAAVSTGSSGQLLVSGGADVAPTMSTVSTSSGKVLQVVYGTDYNAMTFDGTIVTVLSKTINNVLSDSKVLMFGALTTRYTINETAGVNMIFTRGTTNLLDSGTGGIGIGSGGSNNSVAFTYKNSNYGGTTMYCSSKGQLLDPSPDTGSNTYKIRCNAYAGSPSIGHDGNAMITLMEIAA